MTSVDDNADIASLHIINNNLNASEVAEKTGSPAPTRHVKSRTKYSSIGMQDMGVTEPLVSTNRNREQNGNVTTDSATSSPAKSLKGNIGKGSANFLDYYLSLESAVRQKREATGLANDEVDEKEKAADEEQEKEKSCEVPIGWEKHQDDEGAYYWHIATGTIQREEPTAEDTAKLQQPNKIVFPGLAMRNKDRDPDSEARRQLDLKRQSCPILSRKAIEQMMTHNTKKAIRFSVKSLGWAEISEEDLTPEKSSRAVNRLIRKLGSDNCIESAAKWGGGMELYMDVDDECLRLIDPNKVNSKIEEIDGLCADEPLLAGSDDIDEEGSVMHEQPIHTIRVWGVGRDCNSERDFAYVARDRANKTAYLCHVFRCDMPARIIANTLRDACKRAMIERGSVVKRERSTATANEENRSKRFSDLLLGSENFPAPMEEPKKVMKALYVGSIEVSKPVGMDMLDGAIDRLFSVVPACRFRPVKVSVAPSSVTVKPCDNEEETILEARVRFISFMGMGRQVELCSFVVDQNPGSTQRHFVAHVFHCEPSAGPLCKTLEAACKLRYQKCMDAHKKNGTGGGASQPLISENPDDTNSGTTNSSSPISAIGGTLRNVFSQTLRLVGSNTSI